MSQAFGSAHRGPSHPVSYRRRGPHHLDHPRLRRLPGPLGRLVQHARHALGAGELEQADQVGAGFAVGDAVDAAGAPVALEGADGGFGIRVIVAAGLQPVTQSVQTGAQDDHADALIALLQQTAQGVDAFGGGFEPQAMTGLGQTLPGEAFAGIFLAVRRQVGMADDAVVGDGPAAANVADQGDDRRDLGLGEVAIAELMARIDDFYADGGGVAVVLALPDAATRVPGAAFFGNKMEDTAVFLDQIMGGDLGLGIAQARQGRLAGLHPCVMKHQHVGRRTARVEVGRRRVDEGDHEGVGSAAVAFPAIGDPGAVHLVRLDQVGVAGAAARRHGATGPHHQTDQEDQNPGEQGDHRHRGGGEDGQNRAHGHGGDGRDHAGEPHHRGDQAVGTAAGGETDGGETFRLEHGSSFQALRGTPEPQCRSIGPRGQWTAAHGRAAAPPSEHRLVGQDHGALAAHPVAVDPLHHSLGLGIGHHAAQHDQGLGGFGLDAEHFGNGLPRRLLLGEMLEAHGLVGGNFGQLLGLGHRLGQTAQLIHQPQRQGLGAGPDAALGDLAHPFGRQFAARGDAADEVVVDAVHLAREGRALGRGEALARREGVGVFAAHRQAAHVDAEAAQSVGQHELAAEHADGAGQGGRLGHDPVRFGTDPIAARGRIGPHGDHHRLAGRARRAHGGQDLFGRLGRAAGRGDAEDDGLHVLVLDGVVDGLGRVVGMDGGAAAEAAPAAPAGDDGPLAAHDGDGVPARAGALALLAQIFAELDDLGALAGAGLDGDLGLLDLADLVDQAVGQGLFGRIGAGLDQGLQRRGRGLAILGGVAQGAVVDGGHPGGHGLAVRAGVIALGVFVDGVLVLVALLELGLHPILLKGAAQEQAVGREAHSLEAGGVLHP